MFNCGLAFLACVVLLFGFALAIDHGPPTRFSSIVRGHSFPNVNKPCGSDCGGSVFLEAEPLFAGQIVGGKVTRTLGEEITDEAIHDMTDCKFYKEHPDSCYPTDPTTPCRYCKEKSLKFFGEPECPSKDSLPIEHKDNYEWRIKPKSTKTKYKKIEVCMIHEIPAAVRAQLKAQEEQQQQRQPYRGDAFGINFMTGLVFLLFAILFVL